MPSSVPFGKYVLERRLAVGGMAELMLARAPGPDGSPRRVVIKRVIPSRVDDKHYVHMLTDEARIAGHLSHPNVVEIYEFGKVDGQPFIAMEYLIGDDLSTLINQAMALQKPIDVAIACYVAAEVAEGLHHAHIAVDDDGKSLNVVHRDVSPANIIVTADGHIKVVDFGIAKHDMASTQTASGIVKGKVAYMSPEQTLGMGLDARSDVYSLGVVLWEMLASKPCFGDTSLPVTIDAVRKGNVVPIQTMRPEVPTAVARVLASMMAVERNQRCPSAAEVSRALRQVLAKIGMPTADDVREHFARLTSGTLIVTPRVPATIAEKNVMVGDQFASPGMVIDSENVGTVIVLGMGQNLGEIPTQPLGPNPFDVQAGHRPGSGGVKLSYGPPPDTRVVSRVFLGLQRLGLRGFYDRMHLREAQLRQLWAERSPVLLGAIVVVALCLGLGLGLALAFRSGPSTTAADAVPVNAPPGRLKLETAPPGATVTVNGGPQAGVTPLTIDGIPLGVTQSVTLELKGYRRVTQEIVLEPGDGGRMHLLVSLVPDGTPLLAVKPATNVTAAVEPKESAEPATPTAGKRRDREAEPGFLALECEPPMEVRINKRTLGRTPLKGSRLAPGTYSVQLADVDYTKTVEVTIKSGKVTTTRVVLEKGKLLIDVKPWADVYVHNRKIGRTPMPPYELNEGDYKIRIVNPEMGIDRQLPVTIRRGSTTKVQEKL